MSRPVMQLASLGPVQGPLSNAHARMKEMQAVTDQGDLDPLWSAFVIEINRAWSRLAGVMTGGKYAGMFGKLRQQRKLDPLLQYLHQSRHALEHGNGALMQVTAEVAEDQSGTPPFTILAIKGVDEFGEPWTQEFDPGNMIKLGPHTATLIPVTNSGVTYAPPTHHLGEALVDCSPAVIANLAYLHLSQALEDIRAEIVADNRRSAGLPPLA